MYNNKWTGSSYAVAHLLDERKAGETVMSAYEIVMVCLVSIPLVLDLIKVFNDRNQK